MLKCCIVLLKKEGCNIPYRENNKCVKSVYFRLMLAVSSMLMNQQYKLNEVSLRASQGVPY